MSEEQDTTKNAQLLTELKNPDALSMSIDTEGASYNAIYQMVLANELKYVDFIASIDEEIRLIKINLKDLEEFPKEMQEKAIEFAKKLIIDPAFQNSIDEKYIKPSAICRLILTKYKEIKLKQDVAEYHLRLVNSFKDMLENYDKPKTGFFNSLFN